MKNSQVYHWGEIDTVADNSPFKINQNQEKGAFDIIGDVHGCFDELFKLLQMAGYYIHKHDHYIVTHPEGRKVIFVGDLVDRGPKTPDVLRIVMNMIESGIAFCVNGNHDDKLKRKLQGRNVQINHGLEESLMQLDSEADNFKEDIIKFLSKLPSHYVFDDGKLAVSHAGLMQEYIGKESPKIRAFCKYGETTGEVDDFGLPIRYVWSQNYQGDTLIVYGHTPVSDVEWMNRAVA